MGGSAILNASGTGNIIWQNASGEVLAEGNEYISEPLYENTTYYVVNEDILVEAPAELSTGAPNHEGDSEYSGGIYNGGLLFNANSTFTLNSVKVYTEYAGQRTLELHNENGDVVNSQIVYIPDTGDNGQEIELNWEIIAGNSYIITTNFDMNNENFGNNNPMLRRTTDDLPDFPYTIENIVEITEGMYDDGDGPGFSTSYYYYFYDWKIDNEWNLGGTSCLSEPVEVNVLIDNSTEITENNSTLLSIYPNPAYDNLNVIFHTNLNMLEGGIYDHLGQKVSNVNVNNIQESEKLTINISNLSSGLYFISFSNATNNINKPFTIGK
tara:strand:- start:262 stop:1236 length:975 start_codon:yes stop_codon:yes gene_type:complete